MTKIVQMELIKTSLQLFISPDQNRSDQIDQTRSTRLVIVKLWPRGHIWCTMTRWTFGPFHRTVSSQQSMMLYESLIVMTYGWQGCELPGTSQIDIIAILRYQYNMYCDSQDSLYSDLIAILFSKHIAHEIFLDQSWE